MIDKRIPELPIKPLEWVGRSKDELMVFPSSVIDNIGYALYKAQAGDKAVNVKPLNGFGDAGVLEIVEDYAGDTYRAVYTVRLASTIYVLHCFQKKSKKGIKTPKQTISLIHQRLKWAIEMHKTGNRGKKI